MRKTPLLPALVFLVLFGSCGPETSSPPAVPSETPAPEAVAAPAGEPTAVSETPPAPSSPEPVPASTPPPAKQPSRPSAAATPSPEPSLVPAPEVSAATPPPAPAVPPPAPDLKLEPSSALQSAAVTVRTGPLPSGTVVKYTLDGSDPAAGKPWPQSGLAVGQSGTLRVWAALPGGDPAAAEGTYTVGEVWVQPGAAGDGSWNRPAGTLDEALAKAGSLGIKRLRLMGGQYATKTDLSGSWDLSGGWKAPGETGAPSVLTGVKQSGATQKQPAYTLRIGAGAKITLASLEVRSPSASFGAAVLVEQDAAVEIVRSRLVGGNGLYGYGLKASGAASVLATDSFFHGGDGGSSFALSAEKSAVKLVRSTLDAGTGDAVSYGINLTLSKLTLISSVVWGGAANSSYAVGLYSSEGSTLSGSTLLGGRGSSSWAVYLSESDPEIVGCLIGSAGKAKSYGIFVNYGRSLPKVLRSNAFFGSSSGAFTGASLGEVSAAPGESGAFLDASGNPFPGQKANLKAEPALGPAPDYRMLSSSPAALLRGSEALTGEAALDRAGKARGSSPAFGAWATSP